MQTFHEDEAFIIFTFTPSLKEPLSSILAAAQGKWRASESLEYAAWLWKTGLSHESAHSVRTNVATVSSNVLLAAGTLWDSLQPQLDSLFG